jgi:uncharacterized membrane protein YczE
MSVAERGSPRRLVGVRLRILRLLFSWVAVAVGVSLLVRAELGVAPFDVLNTGLSDRTGWSFGLCFLLSGLTLFVIGRLLGGRLGIASVAGAVTIGPMINVFLRLIHHQEKLAVRVPFLLGGIAIIGMGICFGIASELGPGPSEVFMLGLVNHGVGLVVARWISDLLPIVIGVVLGGALGVGTIAFLILMGPMVKIGLRLLRFDPHRATQEVAAPTVALSDG